MSADGSPTVERETFDEWPDRSNARYDWARWFDGAKLIARPGRDFPADMPLERFRNMAQNRARDRGIQLHTCVANGAVYLQAIHQKST